MQPSDEFAPRLYMGQTQKFRPNISAGEEFSIHILKTRRAGNRHLGTNRHVRFHTTGGAAVGIVSRGGQFPFLLAAAGVAIRQVIKRACSNGLRTTEHFGCCFIGNGLGCANLRYWFASSCRLECCQKRERAVVLVDVGARTPALRRCQRKCDTTPRFESQSHFLSFSRRFSGADATVRRSSRTIFWLLVALAFQPTLLCAQATSTVGDSKKGTRPAVPPGAVTSPVPSPGQGAKPPSVSIQS
jgi:hypothetical protein